MRQKEQEALKRMWREVIRKMDEISDKAVERRVGKVIHGGKVEGERVGGTVPETSLPEDGYNGTYSPVGHDHDGVYSPVGHDHDGVYSPVGHDHDAAYSAIAHEATHEQGGADALEIADLGTAEIDDTLVMKPDGIGGVAWSAESGGEGGSFDPDTPIDYFTMRASDDSVWTVTVGDNGALVTTLLEAAPTKPELVSITDAGTNATPALPTGWQEGDLLVVCTTHFSGTSITVDGFPTIVDEAASSFNHQYNMAARHLTASDGDPLSITYNSSSCNAQLILLRNAEFLRDASDNPIVQGINGTSGTFTAKTGFSQVGLSFVFGSNYNDASDPTLTSDDSYASQWLVNAGSNTRHRGYMTEVTDPTAEIAFSWSGGSSLYGMAQVVLIPEVV